MDRVFPTGRIYGGGKLYENGTGQARKRALVLMTTGGGADAYGGYGFNPPMDALLTPIHHGIFWFNGFLPLDPFIVWSPVRIEPEARRNHLAQLDERLRGFFTEPPHRLPPLADFPDYGTDTKQRFMVTVTRTKPVDDTYRSLVPAERACIAAWKKEGHLLDIRLTPPDADPWRGFLLLRSTDAASVRSLLQTLPLAPYLHFEISELARI